MKKIKHFGIDFLTTCILILFVYSLSSCNNKSSEISTKTYVLDTTFTMDGESISLKVSTLKDYNKRIVSNNNNDWIDEGFESKQYFFSINSSILNVELHRNGWNDRNVDFNMDLLSAFAEKSKIPFNKENEALSEAIEFTGYDKNFLRFKLSTYIPGGEGGGLWTIGVSKHNYMSKNHEENPYCVLIDYNSPIGEDIRYINPVFQSK